MAFFGRSLDALVRSTQTDGQGRDVAVARLIATPTGERPLRTTVGGPMTQLVRPINQATEGVQAQLLQFMGLADLSGAAGRGS